MFDLGFLTDRVAGIDLGQQDICIDHMGTMLPLRAYRPRLCVAKETMLVTLIGKVGITFRSPTISRIYRQELIIMPAFRNTRTLPC